MRLEVLLLCTVYTRLSSYLRLGSGPYGGLSVVHFYRIRMDTRAIDILLNILVRYLVPV